ncbi:MAG TPA: porin family protein [Bacteroidales bacterium]|nr:porin family protein [Bacteroidales bacterium]
MKTYFRTIFLIAVILVNCLLSIFSQGSNQSVLSIGTKQGVTFSKIIFEPPVKQKVTPGYTGGLVIKYVSETHAGIQAEINYSQRGWTEKFDTTNSYKRRLNYFEMPILTHFVFGKTSTKVIINVGPNLSYLSSDKETFKLISAGDTLPYYQRKLDKEFELGLVGGIGLQKITSIGDFQLEFRFHYGLQNIFSTNKETNLDKSQNQLYAVTLSYFFFKKDFKAGKNK